MEGALATFEILSQVLLFCWLWHAVGSFGSPCCYRRTERAA